MTTKPETGKFPWQYLPKPGRVYGASTVTERGQISLPADARRELNIDPGDKLMVFGNKLNGTVILVKAEVFEGFADFFTTKINKLSDSAQAFWDVFTASPTEDEPDDADDAQDGQATKASKAAKLEE